jgi:hypothetical protein
MRKTIFILALVILMPVGLFGQTIDPTVEVSREFDVKLGEIHKPEIPKDVADSLRKFNISFDYSIFNRPYRDLYEFSPYESAAIKPAKAPRHPISYLKLGTQFPLTPSAEFYLQAVTKKGFYAGIYADHDSYWGEIPSVAGEYTLDVRKMRNDFGANLKYAWKEGEFSFDAGGLFSKYTGRRDSITAMHDISLGNFAANVKSADGSDHSVYYDIDVAFIMGSKRMVDTLRENNLSIGAMLGTTFDVHRIYVDFGMSFSMYGGFRDHTAGILEISPIYEYNKGRFLGKFGAKFGNRFSVHKSKESRNENGDNHSSIASTIFPDVDARFELAEQSLWIHTVVGGGHELNSFLGMTRDMPLISPRADLKFGSRPLDATLSLESVIKGRMAFNLISSYTIFRDKLLFEPVMSDPEPFDIVATYWDFSRLSFGADALWKSGAIITGAEFRYNLYFSGERPKMTQLPSVTTNFFFVWNWRNRINAKVECRYISEVTGDSFGAYTIPSIVDMGITLDFSLNRYFGVFLKGGNLLNRGNCYMPMHNSVPRNFGGGIYVKF